MDIGEVAKRSGVAPSTLRYYEEKGLIASTGRQGLRRRFDPEVLERLALIALGQAAGFSLEEIGRMFGPDGQPRIDRQALQAKADQIDRMVVRLQALGDSLRHAAACPASNHLECPSFRRLLHAAAIGAIGGPARKDPPGPLGGRPRGRGRAPQPPGVSRDPGDQT